MKNQTGCATTKILSIMILMGVLLVLVSSMVFSENLKKTEPQSTVPASSKDFTQVSEFTGTVSMPIPLVSIGDVNAQLTYSSSGVYKRVRMENQFAPSGFVGLGWDFSIASISGEINNSADTSDDQYFYTSSDANFKIVQDKSRIFYSQAYHPWKIERQIRSGKIAGWKITKEDGTIFRFGNYIAAYDSFYVDNNNNDSTIATRFLLGYNKLVANVDSSLFSNMELIPYQWDLSDVQDIYGNHTTIKYRQVLKSLVAPYTPLDTTTLKYTRESHPYKITDNRGGEIEFVHKDMDAAVYYNYPQVYTQNIFEKRYLDSIYIKRNGQIAQKIGFTYKDTLLSGIKKKYLIGFRTYDPTNKALPSYIFDYYYAQSDTNPGALKSVLDPQGSKVFYTYKSQILTDVKLDTTNFNVKTKYWEPLYSLYPIDEGFAGKDFVAIHTAQDSVYVYRLETVGWKKDDTFPVKRAEHIKVYNDYVVTVWDTMFVVRKTPTGWEKFNVSSKISDYTGYYGVVGVGLNYFVVKYNYYDNPIYHDQNNHKFVNSYKVAIIRFTPSGLKVDALSGRYYDRGALENSGMCVCPSAYDRIASMRAFCGENYVVLASLDTTAMNYSTICFSHFRYVSDGNWECMKDRGDQFLGMNADLDLQDPCRVYIGKNFVVYVSTTIGCVGSDCSTAHVGSPTSKIKVYLRTGSQLKLIDSTETIMGSSSIADIPEVVVGDDYCAYSSSQYTAGVWIRTWNGKKFSTRILDKDLYHGYISHEHAHTSPLGNKLFVSFTAYNSSNTPIALLGYTTFSADTLGWSSLTLIDSVYGTTGCSSWQSSGTALNENTYANVWFDPNTYSTTPYFIMRAYQFRGNSFVTQKIDSMSIPQDGYNNPSTYVWQPGNNFFALNRYINNDNLRDSIKLYTFADGVKSMRFKGTPTEIVVDQKTVMSGMGDSLKYVYQFDKGAYNEFLTAQYNRVTVTPPGSIGKTINYYYNDLDGTKAYEFIQALNYKELDGVPYKTKALNSAGDTVQTTTNFYKAVAINDTLGVFYQQMDSTRALLDGVTNTTRYEYNSTNLEASKITEDVDAASNLSGLRDKVTEITYASQFSSSMDSTHAHMLTQVSGKKVKAIGSNTVLLSQDSTQYNAAGLYLCSKTFDGTNWITTDSVVSRDTYGNILESDNIDKVRTIKKYGYNSTLPIASVANTFTSQFTVSVFDDGDVSSWSGAYGTWILQNGAYRQTDGTTTSTWDNPKYVASKSLGDGIYEADIRFDNAGTYRYAAVTKFVDANNFVRFELRKTDGKVRVQATSAGSAVTADAAFIFNENQWYHVRGEIQGSTAKLYINGILIATLSHYYISMIGQGTIGLATFGTVASFDNARMYPLGALATSTTYDPVTLLPIAATDANGISTFSHYDGFGRVDTVSNFDRAAVRTNSYWYSRDSSNGIFNKARPNYVETKSYPIVAGTAMTSRVYTDGLGRTLQSHAWDGVNDFISAVEYDAAGRQYRAWRAYSYNTGHAYDTLYSSHATSIFGISTPYTERRFYANPLSRDSVSKIVGQTSLNEDIKYLYGSATIDSQPCTSVETQQRTTSINPWTYSRVYTDRLGRTLRTMTDSVGGAGSILSKSRYTILGQLDSVVSPRGLVTNYIYNFLGQMTQKKDPDEGTSKYMYDKAGRLRFMVDSVGLVASPNKVLYWTYDVLGRVTEKGFISTLNWGDPVLQTNINNRSYPSTPVTWRKKYTYDFSGRLASVVTNNDDATDNEVEEYFTYDKFGNIATKGLKVIDYSVTTNYTGYTYDLLGRVTKIGYPVSTFSNDSVNYVYDQLGRTTQAGHTGGTPFATYVYDNKGQMQTETLNPNGPPPIQIRTFSYTAKGLLTSISNSLYSETLKDSIGVNSTEKFYHGLYASVQTSYGTMTPTPPQYTYKFRYDKYGRLDKADNNNYNNWDIGVTNATTYDLNGNITQLQRASMGSKTYTYKPNTNTPQTITGWSYTADVTGNITSAGSSSTTLSYDPFTQLTMREVKGTRKQNYQYDGAKERVLKTDSNGTVTQTAYYRGLQDYPLQVKSGTNEYLYVYGIGGMVAMRMNGTWYYVMRDHLGSTKLIVNGSNTVMARYEYDPYGKTVDSYINTGSIYQFTGQELDETGNYNFRARRYDTSGVVFLAPDPAGQNFSRYGYVGGNPISLVDPTGRWGSFDQPKYYVNGSEISSDMYNESFASQVENYMQAQQHNMFYQAQQQRQKEKQKEQQREELSNPKGILANSSLQGSPLLANNGGGISDSWARKVVPFSFYPPSLDAVSGGGPGNGIPVPFLVISTTVFGYVTIYTGSDKTQTAIVNVFANSMGTQVSKLYPMDFSGSTATLIMNEGLIESKELEKFPHDGILSFLAASTLRVGTATFTLPDGRSHLEFQIDVRPTITYPAGNLYLSKITGYVDIR